VQLLKSAVFLVFFTLNSVMGGADALLLCFHEEGSAHWKVSEEEPSGICKDDHGSSEMGEMPCGLETSPCYDIVLTSPDYSPLSGERLTVEAPKEGILTEDFFGFLKSGVDWSRARILAESRGYEGPLQSVASVQVVRSVQLRL
jgi:hypothetical protein